MKKIAIFSLVAVMAMAAVSCQKEDLTNGPVFKASSPNFASKDGKTVFDGTNTFRWKNKDRIHVWDAAGNHKLYNAVCNDGDAYATLTPKGTYVNTSSGLSTNASPIYGNLALNSTYRAIYPDFYADTTVSNPGQVTITIPQTQAITNQESDPVGSDNGLHLTRFPSYCQSNSTTMPFKNLCGALKLILQADNTYIESIKFTSKTNGLPVAGTFTINWNNGNPILTPATGNNCYSTTLSYAVKQSIDHPHAFWLCLPAGYYSDYEIEITNSNYEKCYISSHGTIPIEIARSEYTVMRLDNNQISTHFESGDGIFSVSATKRVYFSPGNLQCVNNHWQFANEQYEVIHSNNCTHYDDEYAFSRDMFGWSTANSNYGISTNSADYDMNGLNTPCADWGNVFGDDSPWFTLTKSEWNYLMNQRSTSLSINGTSNVRYAAAGVLMSSTHVQENPYYGYDINGYMPGVLLFPDDFTISDWPTGVSYPQHLNSVGSWPNRWDGDQKYTIEEFEQLERLGVIFLPITGDVSTINGSVAHYNVTGLNNQNSTDARLCYWTSTNFAEAQWGGRGTEGCAYYWYMDQHQNAYNMAGHYRTERCAVRLVRQVPSQND